MQTILLLENNAFTLAVMDALLSRAGYTLLKATDERAALAFVNNHDGPIHLLIADADANMRRTNQRTVLQASRPEMKVILISKSSKQQLLGRGILKPDDVLLKRPFTIGELRDLVSQTLGGPEYAAG